MSESSVREQLTGISAVFRAQPEKARAKNAPAKATLESGLKCQIVGPQGESIRTDMPAALGGSGSAPNPGWFMRPAPCVVQHDRDRHARRAAPQAA